MFLNLIIKEYNLNIINLNYLLNYSIETELGNFIYNNNLDLKINSRDLKKLTIHFINSEILKQLNDSYKNILIFNYDHSLVSLQHKFEEIQLKVLIHKCIDKSIKTFGYSFLEIKTTFEVNQDTIYNLKLLSESKKTVNYKKLKEYCKTTELRSLSKKIESDTQIKMILHK
jgi:hypothetical protein